VVVTLADVGGCWEFQDNYTCIKPNSIDYCSALTAAGCGQTSSVCSDTAFNGTCNTYTKTFRCGTSQGTPTNTVRLDNTYTLVNGYGQYEPMYVLCAEFPMPPVGAYLR
jgi:conjugal transfer mating pair stabilization protein TraN